jgi:hypothetical protein
MTRMIGVRNIQLKVEYAPVTWSNLILAYSNIQENTDMKITSFYYIQFIQSDSPHSYDSILSCVNFKTLLQTITSKCFISYQYF